MIMQVGSKKMDFWSEFEILNVPLTLRSPWQVTEISKWCSSNVLVDIDPLSHPLSFDGSSPLLHQILLFVMCSNPSKEANCQKGVSWRRFCFHEKGLATLFAWKSSKLKKTYVTSFRVAFKVGHEDKGHVSLRFKTGRSKNSTTFTWDLGWEVEKPPNLTQLMANLLCNFWGFHFW